MVTGLEGIDACPEWRREDVGKNRKKAVVGEAKKKMQASMSGIKNQELL